MFVTAQACQRGQDMRAVQLYLEPKNIQHTVRYTELSSEHFEDFGQLNKAMHISI